MKFSGEKTLVGVAGARSSATALSRGRIPLRPALRPEHRRQRKPSNRNGWFPLLFLSLPRQEPLSFYSYTNHEAISVFVALVLISLISRLFFYLLPILLDKFGSPAVRVTTIFQSFFLFHFKHLKTSRVVPSLTQRSSFPSSFFTALPLVFTLAVLWSGCVTSSVMTFSPS